MDKTQIQTLAIQKCAPHIETWSKSPKNEYMKIVFTQGKMKQCKAMSLQ